tara:strand:- start:2479 stop:3486 length:1008 start_codon:yes stop_codon:yes gene_type:complete
MVSDSFLKERQADEAVLSKKNARFVLLPIRYPDLWKQFKQHEACFWTSEELDLSDDKKDWEKLNDKEKHFIKMILAFFAASDGIVNENINCNFYDEVQIPEARAFYTFQAAMETIHAETYALLLQSYVTCSRELDFLLNSIENLPSVKEKAEWCFKWMNPEKSFARRIVAFACVEGIFFSGSFCAIYWLKKRGLCPGLTFSNELISRDEGLHTEFACSLYKKLSHKLDNSDAAEIVGEAVLAEQKFICESLPCSIVGMNSNTMSDYIKMVADRLLVCLGHDKIYHTKNPFDWMELISMQGKTNFFEKRVGEYQKCGVMADNSEGLAKIFDTETDF